METLPQQEDRKPDVPATRKVQLFLDEDAFLRLKLASAKTRRPLGKIASEAIREHVPEVAA